MDWLILEEASRMDTKDKKATANNRSMMCSGSQKRLEEVEQNAWDDYLELP